MRCGVRAAQSACTVRGQRGDGSACGVHADGPTQGYGGQGTRGAHVEHLVHGRDLGRVEAERLVELECGLPSRKAGIRCGAKCGPGAGGRAPAAAHERHARREGPAEKAGGRACAERT